MGAEDIIVSDDEKMAGIISCHPAYDYSVLRAVTGSLLAALRKGNSPAMMVRMMHDFQEKCVDAMLEEVLQKYVRYYKETPKGRKHMCKVMDKIHKDGYRDGEKSGEKRKSKMIARSLYKSGMSIQEIMVHTRESEQQIRKWVLKA